MENVNKDPFYCFDEVIKKLSTIQTSIKLYIDEHNPKSELQNLDLGKENFYTLEILTEIIKNQFSISQQQLEMAYDKEIGMYSMHSRIIMPDYYAIEDIKKFLRSNGSQETKDILQFECEKIKKGFIYINNNISLLTKYNMLNEVNFNVYINNVPQIERTFYINYVRTYNYFYEFYNNLLDVLNFRKMHEYDKEQLRLGETVELSTKPNKSKPSPRQLALFVWFLSESEEMERLKDGNAQSEFCINHGNVDFTNFQKKYNSISKQLTEREKKSVFAKNDLIKVLDMLKDFPEALKKAQQLSKRINEE